MNSKVWLLVALNVMICSAQQQTPPIVDAVVTTIDAVVPTGAGALPSPVIQAGVSNATTTRGPALPPRYPVPGDVAVVDMPVASVGPIVVAPGEIIRASAGTGTTSTPNTTLGGAATSTTTPSPAAPNSSGDSTDHKKNAIGIGAAVGVVLLVVVLVAVGLYFMRKRRPATSSKTMDSEASLEMIPHHDPFTSTQTWNTKQSDQHSHDINAVEL